MKAKVALRVETGLKVDVYNGSDATITGVTVTLGDHSTSTASIRPHEKRTFRLRTPSGESHLRLSFLQQDREVHTYEIGGYFERGYSGGVPVFIGSCVSSVVHRSDYGPAIYLDLWGFRFYLWNRPRNVS